MTFKHPANGHTETIPSLAWLWMLLLGFIYLAIRGIWPHVLISLILAVCTAGISWFIYPFFIRKVIRNHYLKNGWIEVRTTTDALSAS